MQMDGKRAIVRARLGKRIHDLREAQSVSQYQFCEMVRMDRSYLIGVEKGRKNISIDNLGKIADGLDISLSELFAGIDMHITPEELRHTQQ